MYASSVSSADRKKKHCNLSQNDGNWQNDVAKQQKAAMNEMTGALRAGINHNTRQTPLMEKGVKGRNTRWNRKIYMFGTMSVQSG